jgi:hypothetical protein
VDLVYYVHRRNIHIQLGLVLPGSEKTELFAQLSHWGLPFSKEEICYSLVDIDNLDADAGIMRRACR